MFFKIILSVVLFYSIAFASADTYEGYKIYDIQPANANEKEVVNRLAESGKYDFFTLPRTLTKAARVMVQPTDQHDFERNLNDLHINYTVVVENVGRSEEKQRIRRSVVSSSPARADSSNRFTRFQRHNEINAYLDSLAQSYPDRVTVKSIGSSYEGRDLKTIVISNGDGRSNKNVILIDAGIHAREWIAPAAALYVIYQLVENFNASRNLLQDYNWEILPVVNPDGYEFSHTNSRLWRKTRKPNRWCNGTDANRNFDFHWGEVGASSDFCSNTFKGTAPFSEPETQALRNLMLSLSGRAKMYLTLHSFGNKLLYPWGYTSDLPSTWQDIESVAYAGSNAILAASGNNYTVGSSTRLMGAAAGGSDDYALAVARIPISITMELPSGGDSGFDPTPRYIIPMVADSWVGIKAMAEKVISKYSNRFTQFQRHNDSSNRFTRFQRHNEINAYLDSLAQSYPDRVTVKSIGSSYEGRDLKTIVISNGDGRSNKKVILIDAGIHAREWIAPAAALYVIYQLVENFNASRNLLQDYNWEILPVVNPDGYEFSHTNLRMWLKTRKPTNPWCNGTDANRNFDFHWGEVGASSDFCSDTFKGTAPFSEPETEALRKLMVSLKGRAKMYLTLHSYGQYLLYPWGYTTNLPSTWQDMREVAYAGSNAIEAASGNRYTVGSAAADEKGAAAGGSCDYALAVAEIPISITMKLSPGGDSGFDPTPRYIIPMVAETWVGIKAMAEKVISKY